MSDADARIRRDFWNHPKVTGLSCEALGAWVKGLSWVADKMSNGRISATAAKHLKLTPRGIEALVKVGLWEVAKDFDGWIFHDYLDHNPSAEDVRKKLDAAKTRAAKTREAKREKKTDSSSELSDGGAAVAPTSGQLLEPNSAARAAMRGAERISNVVSIEAARSAESIGAQWYAELTSVTPDFNSWRKFYAEIGAKPKHERDLVTKHARETTYFIEAPSGSSPEHFVMFWHDFVARPRNFDRARPPVNTRAKFQPGAPSPRSEIERHAANNPAWAKKS